MRSPARSWPGQALVEIALAMPVLLLVVIGAVECFRAFNVKHVVTDAAREGARHAVVQDPKITQDSVRATILLALSRASIPPAAATIQFDTSPPPAGHWRETGALQTVFVSVPYRFGFLSAIIRVATGSDTIRLAALTSMRNE